MRPPQKDIDSGYAWITLLGINIINMSVLPLQQCFGILFEEKFTKLGITAAQTSLILHLNSFIMCFLGLFSGPIFLKFNFKQVALTGCAFTVIAITFTSQANSFPVFIFSYCVLLGFAQGLLNPAISLSLNTYFSKKRSIAMGIAISVSGLGPTFTPYICNALIENFGVNGTVLILAAVAFHSFIGALLLKPVRKPKAIIKTSPEEEKFIDYSFVKTMVLDEVHGSKATIYAPEFETIWDTATKNPLTLRTKTVNIKSSNDNIRSRTCLNQGLDKQNSIGVSDSILKISTQEISNEKHGTKNSFKDVLTNISSSFHLELLKDCVFINIIIGMSISYVAELNFALMTPFVLSELASFNRNDIAYTMSIQATADIVARMTVPLIAQTFTLDARFLYVLSLIGSCIGRTVLTLFTDNYVIILGTAGLLGFSKGIKAVFQALIIPNYVTLDNLPAASGLLLVLNGVTSLALGPTIGYIHDATNTYVYALYTTSFMSIYCISTWILEFIFCKSVNAGLEEI